MTDRSEILRLIRAEMHSLFGLDEESIVPTARLYEDLDLDSIDAVDLVVRLQTIAQRRISPEQFKSVLTVGDVVTAIDDLMNR